MREASSCLEHTRSPDIQSYIACQSNILMKNFLFFQLQILIQKGGVQYKNLSQAPSLAYKPGQMLNVQFMSISS
jgi:hypothetical protein